MGFQKGEEITACVQPTLFNYKVFPQSLWGIKDALLENGQVALPWAALLLEASVLHQLR